MKRIPLSSLVVALGLGAALPAWSVLHDVIVLGSAPPAPRLEDHPQDRAGSVWIPGYWDYRNSEYVWVGGHFEPARSGYVYVPPRYEQADGRWRMYAGGWEEEHGGLRSKIREKKDMVKGRVANDGDND